MLNLSIIDKEFFVIDFFPPVLFFSIYISVGKYKGRFIKKCTDARCESRNYS